jgi:hypothetical protein
MHWILAEIEWRLGCFQVETMLEHELAPSFLDNSSLLRAEATLRAQHWPWRTRRCPKIARTATVCPKVATSPMHGAMA